MAKSTSLTLRLLKKGSNLKKALKKDPSLTEVTWDEDPECTLYVGTIYDKRPEWTKFLAIQSNLSNDKIDLKNQAAAGILFVPTKKRVIAVCFGHVHFALDLTQFEYDFGLRVALNTIDPEKLRNLDLVSMDQQAIQRSIHSSKDNAQHVFAINQQKDLLRQLAGGVTNIQNISQIKGKDSLQIQTKLTHSEIKSKCTWAIETFEKSDYKKNFEWVDNIKIETDPTKILKLNGKLIEAIKDDNSDLHLSPPNFENTVGATFKYLGTGAPQPRKYDSLCITHYRDQRKSTKNTDKLDDLSHQEIKVDLGDTPVTKWKAIQCFVFETELTSKKKKGRKTINTSAKYFLFNGKWYRVSTVYAKTVEDYYKSIKQTSYISTTSAKNEQKLIEEIDNNSKIDWLNLDKVKINPIDATRAALEPCDFLSKDKEFIHLKDFHGSHSASHLWNQGLISAKCFVSDSKFRKDLKTKLRKREAEGVKKKYNKTGFDTQFPAKSNTRPPVTEWTIIFGIMREPLATGKLDLPFFSKVSLMTVAQELSTLGYTVKLELIKKH